MANIGDLVTTMTCDTAGYATGTATAIDSNKALGGSLDQIIGQLERQKKALQSAGRTTHDNILGAAKNGATEGEIDRAGRLNEEVEALRKKKQAQDAAIAAEKAGAKAGQDMIATLEREKATYGMTAQQVALYTMRQKGASAADMARVETLQNEIEEMERAAKIQRQLHAEEQAGGGAGSGGPMGKMAHGSMVLTESMRGLEDAVAGFTNNGLKGMLQATTNNVGQIGSLIGCSAGLLLGFGSIAALVAVSLVPAIMKWADATASVQEAERKLEAEAAKNHEKYISRIEERRRASFESRQSSNDNAELVGDMDTKYDALKAEAKRLKKEASATWNEAGSQLIKKDELGVRQRELEQQQRMASMGVGDTSKEKKKAIEDELAANLEAQAEAAEKRKIALREHAESLRQLGTTEAARDARKKFEDRQAAKALEDEINAEEGRKVLIDARKRADREKSERANASKSVMEMIGAESQAQLDKIEKENKRKAQIQNIGQAVNGKGIITQAEADRLNASIGTDPKAMTASSAGAAVQAGSAAAYSSIVRSLQGVKEQDAAEKQLKKTDELKTILEKIEQKDPFQITTITI